MAWETRLGQSNAQEMHLPGCLYSQGQIMQQGWIGGGECVDRRASMLNAQT